MFLYVCIILLAGCGAMYLEDDGKASRIELSDGNTIPQMGLGTFLGFDESGQKKPQGSEVTQAVEWAIDAGYRLIDTAPLYLDEDQIGAALENRIKYGVVSRKNMYVVTKLPSNKHAKDKVVPTLRESLKSLKLDYVDLYLIHWPTGFTKDYKDDGTDYLDTWKGMEEAVRLNLTKSIGLSNFNITQIERVLNNSVIKPAVLQVEVNVDLHQKDLVDYCKSKDIVVMAYAPFGHMFSKDNKATKAKDPKLVEIADKHSKTTPQIVLKYLIQRGLVPIPKSTNEERIQQNIDVFNFNLDENDMASIDAMNKNYRTVLPSFWQHHKDYPFERIENPEKSPF